MDTLTLWTEDLEVAGTDEDLIADVKQKVDVRSLSGSGSSNSEAGSHGGN